MRTKIETLFILICLGFLFTGCIMYRAGNLPPVSKWPPEPKITGKTISIICSGESVVNGKEFEV